MKGIFSLTFLACIASSVLCTPLDAAQVEILTPELRGAVQPQIAIAPSGRIHIVFGKDNAEKAFTQSPDAPFFNMLNHGQLSFLFSGLLESDNMQQINGSLGIADNASSWAGDLETNIQGTDPYELPLERTPEGYLSGFSAELELSGNWKTNGFEASGQLNISYAKGNLKVIGTAWITTPRITGMATIALTDTEQAQQLFLDHVPAKKADTSDTPDNDSYLHTSLPDPDKPLAITAWGEMRFTLIDNVRKLDGEVAFVVSPEGYIVTAGHVRFRPNIPLIEGDKKNWNLAHIEHNETAIHNEVHNDREANGGHLTAAEHNHVEHQQNKESRQIYHDKHNAKTDAHPAGGKGGQKSAAKGGEKK